VCLSKKGSSAGAHYVEAQEASYVNEHGEEVFIGQCNMVQVKKPSNDEGLAEFQCGREWNKLEHSITLKLDTGADVNIMNIATFSKLFPKQRNLLKPSQLQLEVYGKSSVKVLGNFHLFLRWNGTTYRQLFHVTNANDSPNLLSRNSCYIMKTLLPCYNVNVRTTSSGTVPSTAVNTRCQALESSSHGNPHKTGGSDGFDPQIDGITASKEHANSVKGVKCSNSDGNTASGRSKSVARKSIARNTLRETPLTKEAILETYSDVFEGLGTFPGEPYKFHLKEDAKPARHAPRKVPIHLQESFQKEIESLVKQGILEPVEHSTDWVNSFVIVEKNTSSDEGNAQEPNRKVSKKLRICLDPRDLNEALQREPYYTRSVEEIYGTFHGKNIFTIADFKKGYWMVVIHPDSRKLTCMATEFGRFQWTRLPMGTVVAQEYSLECKTPLE